VRTLWIKYHKYWSAFLGYLYIFWIWLIHGRWNTLKSFVLLLVRMVRKCYVHGCLLQVWMWMCESCLSMLNLSPTHTMQHSQLNLSPVHTQCGPYCHIYQTPVLWNWLAVFSTAVCLHCRTGWMPSISHTLTW